MRTQFVILHDCLRAMIIDLAMGPARPSFSVTFVVAWLRQCKRPRRASLLVALRAAQPTHHVLQLGIPPSETGERMRHAAAGVATQARKQNFVLPEFIA